MAKKNKKVSNNALATLVVAALLVSIVGVFLAVSRVPGAPLTGQQTGTDSGEALFTLQQVASIRFANATVNFGTGFVNTSAGNTDCTLTTEQTIIDEAKCRNFTVPATPDSYFVLENDGTINVTVTLVSNATAAQFIGGTGPFFRWKIRENETNSCSNLSNTTSPATYATVATSAVSICNVPSAQSQGGLRFNDDNDSLRIDINLTIPFDALAGTKRATLTAVGTAV